MKTADSRKVAAVILQLFEGVGKALSQIIGVEQQPIGVSGGGEAESPGITCAVDVLGTKLERSSGHLVLHGDVGASLTQPRGQEVSEGGLEPP